MATLNAVNPAQQLETCGDAPFFSIVKKIPAAAEATARCVAGIFDDGDGLSYTAEAMNAYMNLKDFIVLQDGRDPNDYPIRGPLGYMATFLTICGLVVDITGLFKKDGRDRYIIDRKIEFIAKKACWIGAHAVDFVKECYENIKVIPQTAAAAAAIRIVGMVGSAFRLLANSAECFISALAIRRSIHKIHKYEGSLSRWDTILENTKANNMTFEAWKSLIDANLNAKGDGKHENAAKKANPNDYTYMKGWNQKLADRTTELKTKHDKLDEADFKALLKKDRIVKHCNDKIAYWTKLEKAYKELSANVAEIERLKNDDPSLNLGDDDVNAAKLNFRKHLISVAESRVARCKSAIKTQKDSRFREALNIALSGTVILGLIITISLQATGERSFLGLKGRLIPYIAISIPVATTSIDLINYVVCKYLKKTALAKADFPDHCVVDIDKLKMRNNSAIIDPIFRDHKGHKVINPSFLIASASSA